MSAVLAVLCLLLAAGAVWLGLNISREKRYEKQISLGDKYLEELDYENAKISYENAIEISEKKAVGYVKLAVLYIETGDYEAALETVEKGEEKSAADQRFDKIKDTIFQKAPELLEENEDDDTKEDQDSREEEKREMDWEQAFSSTLLGQLPLLGADALNYTVADGNTLHQQEGLISAQQVKLEDKLYLACFYIKPGDNGEAPANELHFALYEGENDFSLLGESQLELQSGFGGSYIRSQSLGVFYREEDGKAQWIFVMDTFFWESQVREAAILSFDQNQLSEKWNSLVYGVGGNQEQLSLNGADIIYYSGVEDNGNTPEDVQEAFRDKLEREELSEDIFGGEAIEDLEPVCWLENKTENLNFSGEASYEGTITDYTETGEKLPETEEYTIPEEQWDLLNGEIGALIDYLDNTQRLSDTQAYPMADLDREDMQHLLSCYTYAHIGDYYRSNGQQGALPVLRKPEEYGLIYSEEAVNNYFLSFVGKEPGGILTDARTGDSPRSSNVTYADGEYLVTTGDGAPIYPARYLHGIHKGNRVIASIEVIMLSNGGNSSLGAYQVEFEIDKESVFGHHIVSIQKFPEVDAAFSGVQASSELQEEGQDHSAAMVRDKNFSTAWVEGVSGVGEGESITLSAGSSQKVHGVRIASGFTKSRDLLAKNGRPTRLRFAFSNGEQLEADLTTAVGDGYENPGVIGHYDEWVNIGSDWSTGKDWMNFISFGQEIETEWIKITIVSAQAGSKYEDTCISELVVY